MQLRRATVGDLPAIADVILASLAEDSSWKSLFTREIREDADFSWYVRETLKSYLTPENLEWLVLVAETAQGPTSTVVSVAVWNISLSRYQSTGRDSTSTMCNTSEVVEVMSPDDDSSTIEKLGSLRTTIAFSQKQHFQHLQPCVYLVYLEVLATHPSYSGKGFAKALCAQVIDSAQEHDLPVAVLTSLRGYIFFSGMAFKDLGCVLLRGPDRTLEDCMLKAMILQPRGKRSRPLLVSWLLRHVSA